MISIRDLRKRPELFKKLFALKSDDSDVDQLLVLDEASRKLQTEVNHLQADRNSASKAIGLAKKAGKDASDAIKQTRKLGDRLKEIESKFQKIDKKLNDPVWETVSMKISKYLPFININVFQYKKVLREIINE